MKKISVINQKGGTGKTTTSINLSAGLTLEGKRTLLIDLDPQAHSTLGIGIDTESIEFSTYDILVAKEDIKKAIIPTYIKNLDIIPSHIKLASGSEQMYSKMFRESILENALKKLNSYNFIIIDCPPALGVLTTNAIYASDFMIIPCQMSRYSLDGLADLLDTIEVVKNNKDERKERYYGILLTMFDKRNTITNEYILNQLALYKEFIFKATIMKNEALNQAQIVQQSIFDFDSKSVGAQNYRDLTREVLKYAKEGVI